MAVSAVEFKSTYVVNDHSSLYDSSLNTQFGTCFPLSIEGSQIGAVPHTDDYPCSTILR